MTRITSSTIDSATDRATLALVLYLVWFVVAFLVRAAIQLRRTGDHGFRVGTERAGTLAWWARVGFIGAMLIGLLAPIVALLDLVEPPDVWISGATGRTGLALTVVGIVATFVVQVLMGESWRVGVDPGERTTLVHRGPFRVVRNPIFTTMALTAAGLALLVPSVVSIVGLVALVVALELQVRAVEEPYLRRMHGEAYRRYCAEVGRFVPGLGRSSSSPA